MSLTKEKEIALIVGGGPRISASHGKADPDQIAQVYLGLHRQHRSTWAYEIVLRPWLENW